MSRLTLAAALLTIAALPTTECAAQSSLYVTAPGCESSRGFDVIHGNLLVIGDTVACEYDATTLALTNTIPLPGAASPAALVVEAPGDDFVLSRGSNVNLLDGPTGTVLQTYVNPGSPGTYGHAIAMSGSHVLVSDPGAGQVHVFDASTGTLEHTISFAEVYFGYALAVLGPDVVVASLTGTGTRLRRYDVATGGFLGQFALVAGGPGNAGEIQGRMAVAGADVLLGMPGVGGGAVYLLDGTSGAVVRTFLPPEPSTIAFGIAVRGTASEVLVFDLASGRNGIYIFDRATGTLLRTIHYNWPDSSYSLRERLAVLGARTIVGATVMAYCGGVTGCAPCETCGPSGSCVAAPHPTCQQMTPSGDFRLMFLNTDSGDVAQWKGRGQFGPGGPPDTGHAFFLFGRPDVDTDYALCVYDASSALLFRAEAPADDACNAGPCWRMRGSGFGPRGTYAYRDRDRTPDGIGSVRLFRRTDTGLATLNVRGTGPNLSNHPQGLPSLPLTLPLRAQLQGRDGQCFETTHSTATNNSAQRFVSLSD